MCSINLFKRRMLTHKMVYNEKKEKSFDSSVIIATNVKTIKSVVYTAHKIPHWNPNTLFQLVSTVNQSKCSSSDTTDKNQSKLEIGLYGVIFRSKRSKKKNFDNCYLFVLVGTILSCLNITLKKNYIQNTTIKSLLMFNV